MLPVFIWRARNEIFEDLGKLIPTSLRDVCALGYFLELTEKFGRFRVRADLTRVLRRRMAAVTEPFVLFKLIDNPFALEIVAERTSQLAASWKLVTGEADDVFQTYFERTIQREASFAAL